MTAAPVTAPRGRPTATVVRRRARTGTLFAIMCVIAVVMLYPFFYMLDNAFRNQSQFARQSGHSPVSWGQLFTELPVWRELLKIGRASCRERV